MNKRLLLLVLMCVFVLVGCESAHEQLREQCVVIHVPYPGAGAEVVEQHVSSLIESSLMNVDGLTRIRSTSTPELSEVRCYFDWGTNKFEFRQRINDELATLTSLPNDILPPRILPIDLANTDPVGWIIAYADLPASELTEICEHVKDLIEREPAISFVDLQGGAKRTIRIEPDEAKMEAMRISYQDIQQAISNENLTMSGGTVGDYNIRVAGNFEDIDQLGDVLVRTDRDGTVRVRDVAVVSLHVDISTPVRYNGIPAIALAVNAREANTRGDAVRVAQRILKEQEEKGIKARFQFVENGPYKTTFNLTAEDLESDHFQNGLQKIEENLQKCFKTDGIQVILWENVEKNHNSLLSYTRAGDARVIAISSNESDVADLTTCGLNAHIEATQIPGIVCDVKHPGMISRELVIVGETADDFLSVEQEILERLESDFPEIQIRTNHVQEAGLEMDREKMRRYGISYSQIQLALSTDIGVFRMDEEELNIVLHRPEHKDLDGMLDQKITFRNYADGQLVSIPLRAIVKGVNTVEGAFEHYDGQRCSFLNLICNKDDSDELINWLEEQSDLEASLILDNFEIVRAQ